MYLISELPKNEKETRDVKCLISSESDAEEINHEQSLLNRILRNPANINVWRTNWCEI